MAEDAPRLFIDWTAQVVHRSIFDTALVREKLADRFETGICGHTVGDGDWYQAPDGTMVTCFMCIAMDGDIEAEVAALDQQSRNCTCPDERCAKCSDRDERRWQLLNKKRRPFVGF